MTWTVTYYGGPVDPGPDGHATVNVNADTEEDAAIAAEKTVAGDAEGWFTLISVTPWVDPHKRVSS